MAPVKPKEPLAPAYTDGDWVVDFEFYADVLTAPEDWSGDSAALALVPRSGPRGDDARELTSESGLLMMLANGVGVRVPEATMNTVAPRTYDVELRRFRSDGAILVELVGVLPVIQGRSQLVEGEPLAGPGLAGGGGGAVKILRGPNGYRIIRGAQGATGATGPIGATGPTGPSASEQLAGTVDPATDLPYIPSATVADMDARYLAPGLAGKALAEAASALAEEKAGLAQAAADAANAAAEVEQDYVTDIYRLVTSADFNTLLIQKNGSGADWEHADPANYPVGHCVFWKVQPGFPGMIRFRDHLGGTGLLFNVIGAFESSHSGADGRSEVIDNADLTGKLWQIHGLLA